MNRFIALAVAAFVCTATFAQQPPAAAPSRAEVLADLTIYRESGLQELDASQVVMSFTPEYRAAQQRYEELRRSPHYAELVRRYEGREPATQTAAAAASKR